MRIREIIKESLTLPFKEYKLFLIVVLLAISNEIITTLSYSVSINKISLLLMIVNSFITLMILGIMISLTNKAVRGSNVYLFDFIENLSEGIKEYIITIYNLFLSAIISSVFIVPTGVYSNLLHIYEYVLKMDLNSTFLTLHELSHELPYLLKIDFAHSLQLNLIITIFIFIFFMSFSFIGKIILAKTSSILKALNPKLVFQVIKNIGFKRYLKFVAIIGMILLIVINIIITLEILFYEAFFSGILEALIMFFSTNAFYKLIEHE